MKVAVKATAVADNGGLPFKNKGTH